VIQRFIDLATFFTSDSRLVTPESIFVALKGDKTDGHDFVEGLLRSGITAAVVRANYPGSDPRLIKVTDPHRTHRELAHAFRKKSKAKIIAIGGSNGKTTTKEFLSALCETKFRTVRTEKSQNGELGIPRTLEKLRPDTEVAIIEVGIDGPGDMKRHAELVAPDVACLTSIGEEHLNHLKDLETIYSEERILFDVTKSRGGALFAPEADPFLQRYGAPVHFVPASPVPAGIPFQHPHARQNALLAGAVFRFLGGSAAELEAAWSQLQLPEGRAQLKEFRGGEVCVFADHYNANPSSMNAALAFAAEEARRRGLPLTLLLGDMFDLGEETERAHLSLVTTVRASGAARVFFIGPEMTRLRASVGPLSNTRIETFASTDAARGSPAFSELQREPRGFIFLKGSRGMRLEALLQPLESGFGAKAKP